MYHCIRVTRKLLHCCAFILQCKIIFVFYQILCIYNRANGAVVTAQIFPKKTQIKDMGSAAGEGASRFEGLSSAAIVAENRIS